MMGKFITNSLFSRSATDGKGCGNGAVLKVFQSFKTKILIPYLK